MTTARDGTGDAARAARGSRGAPPGSSSARGHPLVAAGDGRLTVVRGAPLAPGWTGKMWAVHQGLAQAADSAPDAAYVLLTDADIEHAPESLVRLVAKAEDEDLDLVSLMALLRCEAIWEQLLAPAFVFFFQKLYPFPWVNDPRRAAAAAAGGCMLVRRAALERVGGVASIRDRLIDDCALARRIKAGGAVWLGLGERTRSLRRTPASPTSGAWWRARRTNSSGIRRRPWSPPWPA